jgi:hypothetical protein
VHPSGCKKTRVYHQIMFDSILNLFRSTTSTTSTTDIETAFFSDEWDVVDYTPFTEPLWGIVVNK